MFKGELGEWSKPAVSKTVVRYQSYRGFESPVLRQKAKENRVKLAWTRFLFAFWAPPPEAEGDVSHGVRQIPENGRTSARRRRRGMCRTDVRQIPENGRTSARRPGKCRTESGSHRFFVVLQDIFNISAVGIFTKDNSKRWIFAFNSFLIIQNTEIGCKLPKVCRLKGPLLQLDYYQRFKYTIEE